MGDSALLQSGAYKFCSSVDIQKRKNEVRLSMSKVMNRCSSSKRRKTSSSSSYDDHGASSFNDHHEDLIWEILFRLPPKHVLQFKCVSKRWHSIISNPVFLRNHSLRYHCRSCPQPLHNDDDFLLLPQDGVQDVLLLGNLFDHDSHPDDQPLADISVLPITGVLPVAKGSDFRFIDSCNGLLIYADAYNSKRQRWPGFRCYHSICFIDDDEDLYYLFNPLTKDYIKLPDLKPALLLKEDDYDKKSQYKNFDTRILFDPSVSLSYKVIRFVYRLVRDGYPRPGTENQSQIYIYSSSESAGSSWRLSTSIAGCQVFSSMAGVFLNGVMYWVTAGTDLLCFDAEKNSVWYQPLPLNPKPNFKERQVYYFGKCGGRLYLIEKLARTYMGRSCLTLYDGFDIMEMTTEDARWTKKYHVNLGVNFSHLIAGKIQILHIYKKTRTNQFKEEEEEEEEEEALLLMKLDGRIVSFSFKSNTFFEKELTIPNTGHPFCYVDVYPTSMTLFPL